MSSDPIVGASLTSSGVVARKATIDELALKENSVSEISHDHTDSSVTSIPSSKALSDAMDVIKTQLQEIDPNNNFFKDNTVITLPLISPSFSEDGDWITEGWTAHDGSISFTGSEFSVTNYLAVSSSLIPFAGNYFFYVTIPRLDSGKIVLYDFAGSVIKEFDSYGSYPVEVTVDNADIAEFKFVAEGVFPGEAVTIDSIMFYRITPRLKTYLSYLFSGGAETGEVTYSMMMDAIAQSQTNTLNLIDDRLSPVEDRVNIHTADFNNPHNLTPAKIGAAPASHTHSPVSIGAATTVHTHEPEQCGAAPSIHTHTPAECGSAPVVHSHIPESIGAADRIHVHDPSDCGAAPAFHTHTPGAIGAAPAYHEHSQYTTPTQVGAQIQSALSDFTLSGESSATVRPMTVLEYQPGVLPSGYEDGLLSPPIVPLVLANLVHQTKHDYDYREGVAITNTETDPSHPIQYAFKAHLDNEDSTINVAAFPSTVSILDPEVSVEYYFHTKRSISGFTLFKDLTLQILGVAKDIDLYVDGKYAFSFLGNDWQLSGNSIQVNLGTVVTGRRFTFVVKTISPDLVSGLWGIRIVFHFDDVMEGYVGSHTPISLAVNNSFGTRVTNPDSLDSFGTAPAIPSVDTLTPLYVFGSIQSNDGVDSGSISLSPFPMEFSSKQKGRPVFIDKFSADKTHPLLGTISCTSEDLPGSPLQALFSSGSESWRSAPDTPNAVITHVFPSFLSISGYKILISDTQISEFTYPNSWTLKGYYLDELDVEQEIILDQIDGFYPSRSTPSIYENYNLNTNFTLSRVELYLTGSKGQSAVGLNQFAIFVDGGFFHTEKNSLTYPNIFPLGVIKKLKDVYDTDLFVYDGPVIGTSCYIPIDGMKIQPNLIVDHAIPNPFQTRQIKIELFTHASPQALNPQGQVLKITEDFIYLRTLTAGAYSLGVTRLW